MTASGSGVPQRDEDSGLHDIKNLASSQRMRLSSRRSTQNPIITDDDVLASSSAGWKAVALPEPARMVSLPELAELPSKAEVKAREKAQKAAEKAAARESKKEIKAEVVAPVAVEAPVAAPVTAPIATAVAPAQPIAATVVAKPAATVTPIGSRVAAKKSGSSTKILAIAGIGLAAAAGVTIFVMTQKNSDKETRASTTADSSERSSSMAAPELKQDSARGADKKSEKRMAQLALEEPKKAEAKEAAAAGSGMVAPADTGSAATPVPPPPPPTKIDNSKVDKTAPPKKAPDPKPKGKEPPEAKVPEKPTGPGTIKPDDGKKTVSKGGGKPGEPDFDALLKEAGVKEKSDAPKLTKKQLSMGEFKAAMAGITGIAQKCYQGTSGTALVRVSIAPSGKITGVQVTGAFAGTPVGTCVENAVRNLSFPAWDGPPQSFGYSYLLAE